MHRAAFATLLFAALAATPAPAHEFIVKPDRTTAAAGAPVGVSVLSSHVFMTGEELEEARDVRLAVVADGRRSEVPLARNEATLAYEAVVPAPSAGPFLLLGHRLPQVWATTPEGTRPATKRTPGASNAFKIEKFAKTLVNLTPASSGYDVPVGDALEIVPLANPAALAVGQELPVRILARGQPHAGVVTATYDGFSGEENTYAFYTEGKADGTAKVKITAPGLWMVRVQYSGPERTDDYDRYVARATLVFAVR